MPSVNFDSSVDATIVAAPGAGRRIQLLGYTISSAAAVECRFQDDTGTPIVLDEMLLATNSQRVVPPSESWEWFCGDNKALTLDVASAVRVCGSVNYKIVGFAAAS